MDVSLKCNHFRRQKKDCQSNELALIAIRTTMFLEKVKTRRVSIILRKYIFKNLTVCKGVQYDLLVGGRENTIKSNQHLSITHSGGFVPYKSHIHLALGKHILHRVSIIIIFYYNSEPVGGLSRIFFSFCYSVKSPNMTGIQPFFFLIIPDRHSIVWTTLLDTAKKRWVSNINAKKLIRVCTNPSIKRTSKLLNHIISQAGWEFI